MLKNFCLRYFERRRLEDIDKKIQGGVRNKGQCILNKKC